MMEIRRWSKSKIKASGGPAFENYKERAADPDPRPMSNNNKTGTIPRGREPRHKQLDRHERSMLVNTAIQAFVRMSYSSDDL